MSESQSAALARFAATLQYQDIPADVIERAKNLYADWVGSALAGKGGRPVEALAAFARRMAPASGRCEVLISRERTTPYFAAFINGASSHYAEQDDVHNGSVFHPAAVVFPAALAIAQEIGASGKEFLTAAIVGYEVGIRVGEFLGRSHYRVFHTTGTAGTLAAAAAAGRLLGLTAEQMLDAFGSAGTQAAGLWEFLADAADSKQLHTAKAAADGLMAACLAKEGFKGAKRILEGPRGMAAGMSTDADAAKLVDRLKDRWTVAETSFKFHASCRHTHPAADALAKVLADHKLSPADVREVVTYVHQGAIDVLGPVVNPTTVHQAKFSMGTVLGLIAERGSAGVQDFETHYQDAGVVAFRNKVSMRLDAEVDTAYPQRWIGKVTVTTKDGQHYAGRVDEPKGDPGNTLSRKEIEEKFTRLVEFSSSAIHSEVAVFFQHAWELESTPRMAATLPEHNA
ncbi:MmgE/PrpD family protein [Cupriavidus sp. TMH.W2]|uniref:MmgE/PrpD family protein n=1 Tax=Cupriavidus sp. TMH.W2 TaxID=3434465 RepID=UPI003D788163